MQLNSCLTLRAYPAGLGVGIWRIFGMFQKALRIPWSEIDAQPKLSTRPIGGVSEGFIGSFAYGATGLAAIKRSP